MLGHGRAGGQMQLGAKTTITERRTWQLLRIR